MRLLLDTHVWLWSLLEPERLQRKVRLLLSDPANERWLSPISAWETTVLAGKRRLTLGKPPGEWIIEALSAVPMREAPLTNEVVFSLDRVQIPRPDPADRFLAATAAAYGLTLVTADELLLKGTGFKVLKAA